MPVPRVRFAPAPSGWLHVGGARTALFNVLHARHHGGAFVLRIEDTDAERASDESMQGMLASLAWLDIDPDEGPHAGGPYGPYRQSERGPLYAAVADLLLRAGHVYDAYETPEELAEARTRAQEEGRPPGYDGAHRELSQDQREAFMAEGRRPTLRVRTPDEGTVAFDDPIRGRIEFAWSDVADFVVTRADGSPTYPLANTVDDLAMGISLVARGEDLLAATPRQLLVTDLLLGADGLLDEALGMAGFPARPGGAERPAYAHLPIIVGTDRKKLSKRHGSVAVDEFRRQGILPDTLVNVLALCGWSPESGEEQMDRDALVEQFSFERVGRNPAFFDEDKLRSFNGDRIRAFDDRRLADELFPILADAGLVARPPTPGQQALLHGFAPLLRERIQTLAEAVALVAPFFAAQVSYDEAAVRKHLRKEGAAETLSAAEEALADAEWTDEGILAALDGVAEARGVGRGKAFQPVRVAVAGTAVSPPLPETLALLDRELVLERVRHGRTLTGTGHDG